MASGLQNVLIVAYLLIVLAMIGVILLQRSEGGGLGMGSSNSNGLISVRGSANLLTRTTAILAALFFATAIGLTILSGLDSTSSSILSRVNADGTTSEPATALDALKDEQGTAGDLPVPAPATDTTTPATDTTAPATDAAPAAPATDTSAPATPAAPAADPGLALPTPTDTAPAATPATPAAPAQ